MADKNNTDLDDNLKYIFSNINDWLKFAEAKSAILIAGNGTFIFGILRLIDKYNIDGYLQIYLLVSVLFSILSLVVCLVSIVPSLTMPWDSKPAGTNRNDNLLYFADIAKYSPLSYLSSLNESLGLQPSDFNSFQKNLSLQIITNAVIANKKFNYFKFSIWLTLTAILSPVVVVLFYVLKKG